MERYLLVFKFLLPYKTAAALIGIHIQLLIFLFLKSCSMLGIELQCYILHGSDIPRSFLPLIGPIFSSF